MVKVLLLLAAKTIWDFQGCYIQFGLSEMSQLNIVGFFLRVCIIVVFHQLIIFWEWLQIQTITKPKVFLKSPL